jgi:predicted HTH transcriptional regulator
LTFARPDPDCTRTKPFDASACPEARLSDIARGKLSDFLAVANAERGYAVGPRTSTQKALTHLNLLDGGEPTHAAVLLFGKQPQRFLISSEVKCMHFHGREVRKPIPSYHIYKGTVFELVDQDTDFVMSKVNRAVIPRDGRVASDVAYELPFKAVREAIVNAVTHRDYTSNASVHVMLFADRLEVWNPGQLPPALTIPDLRKSHASIPHNPLIAEPMFLATYAEKAGSGIIDMFALCREAKLSPPTFRQDGGQFVQTIWRPKTPAAKQVTTQVETSHGLREDLANQFDPKQIRKIGSALGLSTAQVTTQVATQVVKLLSTASKEAKSRKDLQVATDMKNREHFRKHYIEPLVRAKWLKPTIPDKPNSRLQKYRLTVKGKKALETLNS